MCWNIMNGIVHFLQKGTFFFPGKKLMYKTTAIDHKGEKPEVVLPVNLVVPGHAWIHKDIHLEGVIRGSVVLGSVLCLSLKGW